MHHQLVHSELKNKSGKMLHIREKKSRKGLLYYSHVATDKESELNNKKALAKQCNVESGREPPTEPYLSSASLQSVAY